jgi:hypothetical protein
MRVDDGGGPIDELEAGIRAELDRGDIAADARARYAHWLSLIGALRVPMNLDDVADLPPELVRELNIPSDKLESEIIAVLGFAATPVDLDQILIGLYRRFGVVQKRRFLQNKLWRMVSKEQIYKGKNRKGLYALEPIKARAKETARRGKRGARK